MIMKQRWKSVVFEIFFPVTLVILFTWLFREFGRNYDGESRMQINNESYVSSFDTCWIANSNVRKIMYSPSGPWLDSFVIETFNVTYDESQPYDPIEIVGVQSAQALDDYLNGKPDSEQSTVGVQFDDLLAVKLKKPEIYLEFIKTFFRTRLIAQTS